LGRNFDGNVWIIHWFSNLPLDDPSKTNPYNLFKLFLVNQSKVQKLPFFTKPRAHVFHC
jgi:hypothetical protein